MTTLDERSTHTIADEPPAPAEVYPEALEAYLGFVAGQATAAVNAVLVSLGDHLGLWKSLAASGPVTSEQMAASTGLSPRLVREWLAAQSANGFLRYAAHDDTFALPPEGALVLADPDGPASMIAVFAGLGSIAVLQPQLAAGFQTGKGIAWADHSPDFFAVQANFSAPLQQQFLVDAWLAAVPGLVDRLTAGARVADVACGFGGSTILMAQAFPDSHFVGFDFHDLSIARARAAAREAGVDDRVTFELAAADSFPGSDYDAVLIIDGLHDMGDPVAAARHARSTIRPDGVVVTLDPVGADSVGANLEGNPMAGLMYAVSTFLCTPTALAQGGTHALGALGGETAIRQVLLDAGFSHVDRVAPDLPFNMVIVGRP